MEVDKLKRSLKAFKGHFTRATNDAETVLKQAIPESTQVQTIIKVLEAKWTCYHEAYNELELSLLEKEDKEEEVDKLQDEYYPIFSLYEHQLAKLKSLTISSTARSGISGTSTAHKPTTSVLPKLPSIQLPIYEGELTEN